MTRKNHVHAVFQPRVAPEAEAIGIIVHLPQRRRRARQLAQGLAARLIAFGLRHPEGGFTCSDALQLR